MKNHARAHRSDACSWFSPQGLHIQRTSPIGFPRARLPPSEKRAPRRKQPPDDIQRCATTTTTATTRTDIAIYGWKRPQTLVYKRHGRAEIDLRGKCIVKFFTRADHSCANGEKIRARGHRALARQEADEPKDRRHARDQRDLPEPRDAPAGHRVARSSRNLSVGLRRLISLSHAGVRTWAAAMAGTLTWLWTCARGE